MGHTSPIGEVFGFLHNAQNVVAVAAAAAVAAAVSAAAAAVASAAAAADVAAAASAAVFGQSFFVLDTLMNP